MAAMGRYDGSLQMFVESTGAPDPLRLRFMRWLVENNRLEHPAMGASSGPYVQTEPEPSHPAPEYSGRA